MDDIGSTQQEGDFLDALIVGMDLLYRKVGTKKFAKRIYLITDGGGLVGGEDDLDDIIGQLNNTDTIFTVIAINFCENLGRNSKTKTETIQDVNARILKKICDDTNGQIIPSTMAMNIYKQFRSRSVWPVAKFRGPLEIGSNLKILVQSYPKATEEKLPSLKKHSKAVANSSEPDSGKVSLDRSYHIADDADKVQIDNDARLRAYYYGKQLVPVTKDDEELLKFQTEKGLKFLGFCSSKDVPRHYYVGGCDLLIADHTSMEHTKALSALIHALLESDKVIIARYAPRSNSQPRLAALIPHITSRYECMWLNVLPTVEDIRDYQFASLDSSSEKQQSSAADFIRAMDLTSLPSADGNTIESLKPGTTFNPTLQYFYQVIQDRAFSEEEKAELPELDPAISEYVRPDKRVFEGARHEIEQLRKQFTLVEVDDKADKAKKRIYWRDVIGQEAEEHEKEKVAVAVKAEAGADEKVKPEEGKMDFEPTFKISSINPIEDFNKMVGDRTHDRVAEAISQLTEIILKFIKESFEGSHHEKAYECLKVLRETCASEDEAPPYNNLIKSIKEQFQTGKHEGFWRMVCEGKLTLISKNETSSSDIIQQEADDFLMTSEVVNDVVEDKGYEDEMLEDIE